MRPAPVLLLLAGTAASACSLVRSLDYLGSENDTINGGTDGGTDDGTASPGTDGGGFCASQHPTAAFCADFDQGARDIGFVRGASVRIPFLEVGGAVATVDPAAKSPPGAMLIDVPESTTEGSMRINEPVRLTTLKTRLAFELQLRAPAITVGTLATLSPLRGESDCRVYLGFSGSVLKLRLEVGGVGDLPVPVGSVFTSFVLDMDVDPAQAKVFVRASVGGGPPVQVEGPCALTATDFVFKLGYNDSDPHGRATLLIDDVVFLER